MEWFHKGGPIMYPIFLCSILSLAIFIERLSLLINRKKVLSDFKTKLESITNGTKSDVKDIKELIEILIESYVKKLSKGIGTLSLIAKISTLLGLLGTVLGMVEVFKNVSEGKLGDPSALAGGIWVALLTTVFGLSVAIPTVFMHGVLSSIIARREEELIQMGEETLRGYVENKV